MNINSFRDTFADVSLSAISHNVRLFQSHLHKDCKLMAVIKADAYGHGAIPVAHAALDAGADYLGVALLDEALQLRQAGIQAPILVLGYTPPRAVETAVQNDVTITLFSDDVLDELIWSTSRLNRIGRFHLKVDTGMMRIGVASVEAAESLLAKAAKAPLVVTEGIFTHFANADSNDPTYTLEQFRRFTSILQELERKHFFIPIRHCCNTAATIRFPAMHLDMVRVGIGLYGLSPFGRQVGLARDLQPSMQFKTEVAWVKSVSAGQPIGYGCTYSPVSDSVIATIPVGYADGLSRKLSNKGAVLIHGHRCPIVGNVCMDQTMVDVTEVKDVRVGDQVVLFGRSDSEVISIDEVAAHMQTINYEVVCLIGKRVPRIYTSEPISANLNSIDQLAQTGAGR